MAGFLYYVPTAQTTAQARTGLADAGVDADLFEGLAGNHSAKGPDGAGGFILGPAPGPNVVNLDSQEWLEVPGKRYWVGCYKSTPPGPADLALDPQIAGHEVELGDGNRWLIPVARKYREYKGTLGWVLALPRTRRINADGNWEEGDVVKRHRPLWHEVMRIEELYERYEDGDEMAFENVTIDTETKLVAMAIATNYRIGPAEITLLGLIDGAVIQPVIDAVRDMPTLVSLAKKAEASGEESILPGAAE
jgi:hypothetical protein